MNSRKNMSNVLITVNDLLRELNKLIPLKYVTTEENSGLIIGLKSWEISRCAFVVNCTRKVLEECIGTGVNAIIAKNITLLKEKNSGTLEKILSDSLFCSLIEKKIALVQISSALDVMPGGIEDYLPEKLCARKIRPLEITRNKAFSRIDADISDAEIYTAMSVAIKTSDVSELEFAVLKGRAKYIKTTRNYESNTEAQFAKLLDESSEITRLEILCETELSRKIVTNLEMCLKDKVYNVNIVELSKHDKNCGFGRVCELPKKLEIIDLINAVSKLTGSRNFEYINSNSEKIKRIAFNINTKTTCNLLRQALNYGASCIIVSNIAEDDVLYAYDLCLSVIKIDNFSVLKAVLLNLKERLIQNLQGLDIMDSVNDVNMINRM